jgi:hypothetical protein
MGLDSRNMGRVGYVDCVVCNGVFYVAPSRFFGRFDIGHCGLGPEIHLFDRHPLSDLRLDRRETKVELGRTSKRRA